MSCLQRCSSIYSEYLRLFFEKADQTEFEGLLSGLWRSIGDASSFERNLSNVLEIAVRYSPVDDEIAEGDHTSIGDAVIVRQMSYFALQYCGSSSSSDLLSVGSALIERAYGRFQGIVRNEMKQKFGAEKFASDFLNEEIYVEYARRLESFGASRQYRNELEKQTELIALIGASFRMSTVEIDRIRERSG